MRLVGKVKSFCLLNMALIIIVQIFVCKHGLPMSNLYNARHKCVNMNISSMQAEKKTPLGKFCQNECGQVRI